MNHPRALAPPSLACGNACCGRYKDKGEGPELVIPDQTGLPGEHDGKFEMKVIKSWAKQLA